MYRVIKNTYFLQKKFRNKREIYIKIHVYITYQDIRYIKLRIKFHPEMANWIVQDGVLRW